MQPVAPGVHGNKSKVTTDYTIYTYVRIYRLCNRSTFHQKLRSKQIFNSLLCNWAMCSKQTLNYRYVPFISY